LEQKQPLTKYLPLLFQIREISAKKASLDQAINFSEDHLTYSNSAEFLIMKDQIISRTKSLKDQEIDTIPHTTAEMAFDSINMEEEFREFGKVMGDIWSTAAFVQLFPTINYYSWITFSL
jgi:hypothetical protein